MTTLNTTVFINNPLEQFEIKEFFYFGGPLLGAKFSLTNIGLYLIIVSFLVLGMSYLSLNNNKVVPSRWSILQESLFGSIYGMINSTIETKGQAYLPFLYTIFLYVLLSNLIGLVPYSFTPSSHFVFILVIIGVISYIAKAISLRLRLIANMTDSLALFFIFILIFNSVGLTEFLLTCHSGFTFFQEY
jgi:F-type H+-transporting ATPase subunit a